MVSKFDRLVGAIVRDDGLLLKVASCDEPVLGDFGLSNAEIAVLRSGEVAGLVASGASPVSALWLSMARNPEFTDTMSAAEYFEELGVVSR